MECGHLHAVFENEWILTNGLGGYALCHGNMINKRKYNGLLIASQKDYKRIHTLASVEERVTDGGLTYFLDSNHYLNCIYPNGYEHIAASWLRPYPCVLYSSIPPDKDHLIFKEIFLAQNKNAVVIKYTNMGKADITLTLRPKFTLRDHHFVNPQGTWSRTELQKDFQEKHFRIRRGDNGAEAFTYISHGEVSGEHTVFGSVYYPSDAYRGYESVEDVIAPARIVMPIAAGKSAVIIVSAAPLSNPLDEAALAEKFYKKYPLPHNHPDKSPVSLILANKNCRDDLFSKDEYLKILELAAGDFVADGDNIIAGYPWFGPWGRDTLTSMKGLNNLEGGRDTAVRILLKYGEHLNRGLLPNTYGEGGVGLNFDSVDAPLWYVLRSYQYAPEDPRLFANGNQIILSYVFEENHPFFLADDGLIEIRHGNHALTWMDAKVYDTPVTPRFGKPIEINALWYNDLIAILKMAALQKADMLAFGPHSLSIKEVDELAKKVKISLQKFIGPEYPADRIEGNEAIFEMRPNAIIALSLPFDFADKETIKKAWREAKKKLLTPFGLRTLDPGHPAFKQKYIGNQKQRDMTYHQGTVWPYLLFPFVLVAEKVLGEKPKNELNKELTGYIWSFRDGFMKGEMASVAEIWDGSDPFFPKGCPAQAWSVFALLETEKELRKL